MEQDPADVAAQCFGLAPDASSGTSPENDAVPVGHPLRGTTGVQDGSVLLVQAGDIGCETGVPRRTGICMKEQGAGSIVCEVAPELRDHGERQQLLAGIEIFLEGTVITAA